MPSQRPPIPQGLVIALFKALTRLICQIDDAELDKVPARGPLLLVTNHVNILEIPIAYTHLKPRPVTGLVAAHRWQNPLWRALLDACEAIPLRRGEADLTALRRSLDWLARGNLLIVMPEGTRSGDGCLQTAHPGAVLLALRSGAPLLPMAFFGHEAYKRNLSRLRRTPFHIRVGEPFHLDPQGEKVTRAVRQAMIDEVMLRLAGLLPERYRGAYADLSRARGGYLRA